jgi:PHD/YefM family antitoxin component YafN of YafNO toxin-antitoxin module
MKAIKIRNRFKDKDNVNCVIITEADFKYLYEMSELLLNISDDVREIRSMIELRNDILTKKEKEK